MMDNELLNRGKFLVFYDLETGGLNPSKHPIIQIAALAVTPLLEPVEAIELKVKFEESRANKQSLRKNHFSRGKWAREGVDPHEAAISLADFLRKYPGHPVTSNSGEPYFVAQLVAHNAAFDGPFLQAWYDKLGQFLPARFQVLCTMQLALWYFAEHPQLQPPHNFKLATLCEYFGVPFHASQAHEALGDVTATYLLYSEMSRVRAEKTRDRVC